MGQLGDGFSETDSKSDFAIDVSTVNVTGSLKPRLSFGVQALTFFSQSIGFEIVTNINISIHTKEIYDHFKQKWDTHGELNHEKIDEALVEVTNVNSEFAEAREKFVNENKLNEVLPEATVK